MYFTYYPLNFLKILFIFFKILCTFYILSSKKKFLSPPLQVMNSNFHPYFVCLTRFFSIVKDKWLFHGMHLFYFISFFMACIYKGSRIKIVHPKQFAYEQMNQFHILGPWKVCHIVWNNHDLLKLIFCYWLIILFSI